MIISLRCYTVKGVSPDNKIMNDEYQQPEYWNIKVYDEEGTERETIRGLNVARAATLMKIFEREGVQAQSMGFDSGGTTVLESESVNWK